MTAPHVYYRMAVPEAPAVPTAVLAARLERGLVRMLGAEGVRIILAENGVHLSSQEAESVDPQSAFRFCAAERVREKALAAGETIDLVEALGRLEA